MWLDDANSQNYSFQENRFLLFFNYVAILLLFIGVVAGATIAFTTSIDIIHNPMEESLNKYNENPEIKESWDSIQAQVYGISSEIR